MDPWIKNNRGPNKDPCGTQKEIFSWDELWIKNDTYRDFADK